MSKLKKLCDYEGKNIPNMLKKATLAVNISFNRAIGTSPYLIQFGRIPEFKFEESLKIEGKKEFDIAKVRMKRDKVWEKYEKNLIKGERTIVNDLKIGDEVLIFNNLKTNKFNRDWLPGYKIIEIVKPDAYIVGSNNRIFRLNKKHVKKKNYI